MSLSYMFLCMLCFFFVCTSSAPGSRTSQGHFEQGSCPPPGATGPQTKSFQVCRSQVGEGAPCVAPAAQVPVVLLLVQDPHRTLQSHTAPLRLLQQCGGGRGTLRGPM